ncbi:hypothetical protein ADP71_13610 [Vitreoscilla sp. C1]|uniref:siderophore-interacting protein n=1 Tax=Vitreoscilla sp. (strain C1) TaxID=96942 RepID=UPI000CDC22E5|nr:siderophore-interacting protein [Vitreoscilla sp. C1]AUZ04977.1 hypothetical protein ADP71_13610 [Vitreoscilla sp. C1]
MNPKQHTPITDFDAKIDIIDHLNDDHQTELLAIAQAHGHADACAAKLLDIFVEGCYLAIDSSPNATETEVWIPFVLRGDLEEQILYLAYSAMVKQGKSLHHNQKQYFEVLGQTMVSPHMLRLYLKTSQPLPPNAPGFAWLFSLKVLNASPNGDSEKNSLIQRWFQRIFMHVLPHLSQQRREKIMFSMVKDMRYYTLRKVEYREDNEIAWVDIYLHGTTAGGEWAKSLQKGDIIHSTSEYTEATDHLHQGQTLLMADETSLPTVMALLENWHNPIPPILINVLQDEAEHAYINQIDVPAGTGLYYIDSNSAFLDQAIIDLIDSLPKIEAAWAALENTLAKKIRKHLRENHQLLGTKNRVKGYWTKR